MDATDRIPLTMHLDGRPLTRSVGPAQSLLHLLRDELGLPSVRTACGIGVCGACTVRLDGRVVSSCILPAFAADGGDVQTPEGTACDELTEVQQAFVDADAFQCSYCIPAMALTVEACLDERPEATIEDVRAYLGGNLCRCGSYPQVLDAVVHLLSTRTATETGARP